MIRGKQMKFLPVVLLSIGSVVFAAEDVILGFDIDSSLAQRRAEAMLDADVDAKLMDEWLRHMTLRPHHVGAPASKDNAEFIADLLESWGYDVEIAEYQVLLPTPKVREIELVAPTRYSASKRRFRAASAAQWFSERPSLPARAC